MGGRAWHPRVHLWLARARVELERRSQSGAVTNQRMMRSAVLASAALKRNAAPFANAGLLDFRFRPLVPISQRAPFLRLPKLRPPKLRLWCSPCGIRLWCSPCRLRLWRFATPATAPHTSDDRSGLADTGADLLRRDMDVVSGKPVLLTRGRANGCSREPSGCPKV